jgi:hypothetical protein
MRVTHSSIEKTRLPLSSIRRAGGGRRNRLFARVTADPASRALRHAARFAARAGSCTDASFSAVFRYPESRDHRGPAGRGVLPSMTRPATLLGFTPFAGLLPRTGGHAAPGLKPRSRRLNRLATFLSDRAHVSFVPAHPPRLIFVGVIGRRLGTRKRKRRSIGDELASTSGLGSRLRSAFAAHVRPRKRSCLGLGLLQGFRARFRRASRAGSTPHIAITSLRRPTPRAPLRGSTRALQSAHGFAASFPTEMRSTRDLRSRGGHIPVWRPGQILPARERRRRSLQRIDGADAWLYPAHFPREPRELPV